MNKEEKEMIKQDVLPFLKLYLSDGGYNVEDVLLFEGECKMFTITDDVPDNKNPDKCTWVIMTFIHTKDVKIDDPNSAFGDLIIYYKDGGKLSYKQFKLNELKISNRIKLAVKKKALCDFVKFGILKPKIKKKEPDCICVG